MKKIFLVLVGSTVLTCIIVLSYWFYSMLKAEFGIVSALEKSPGGKVSYKKVDWVVNPTKLMFNVSGVEIAMQSKFGQDLVYKIGDIKVSQDYFGTYQFNVKLPENQDVIISKDKKIIAEHKLIMKNGSFVYFNQTNRFNFSADSVELAKEPSSFIVKDLLFDNTVSSNKIQAWKLAINKIGYDNKFVNNLLLDIKFDKYPLLTGINILPGLLSGNKKEINDVIKQITDAASIINGTIRLNSLNFKVEDKWYSLSGLFEVDKAGFPEGDVTVSTNSLESLVNYALAKGMIKRNWLQGNDVLRKVLITSNRGDSISLKIGSSKNKISVEGIDVGRSITLQNLLYW